jgi:hypothetical protein
MDYRLMKLKTLLVSFLLVVAMILSGREGSVARADGDDREYKLKAAFLLNFSKFTTWPDEALTRSQESFNFCVVGKDPFGAILGGLKSKKVGGRNIELLYPETPAEQKRCHLLFVSRSEKGRLFQLQELTGGLPLVTASDIQGFSRRGGIFEFVTRDGKLSFIVNNNHAKKKGLQINASLLNLAAEVL